MVPTRSHFPRSNFPIHPFCSPRRARVTSSPTSSLTSSLTSSPSLHPPFRSLISLRRKTLRRKPICLPFRSSIHSPLRSPTLLPRTRPFAHPSHASYYSVLTRFIQLTITYGSKIVLRTHRGTCLAARQGTPGAASTKGTKAGWRVVANGTSAGEATDNEAVFVVMNANFTRDAGPVKFGDAVAIASVAHNKYLGVNQVEDPATGAVQHGVTLRNNMGRAEKWTLLEAPRKADGRAAAARASSDGWMSGGGAGPSYVEACTRITLRSAAGHFLCAYGQADAIGGEGSAGGAAVDLLGDAALPVGLVDTDLDGLGGMDRLGGAESDRVTWHMMKETSPFVPEVRYQEPRWPFDDLMSVHRALLPM